MYPSDVWCGIKCLRNDASCIFKECCGYRQKYLRIFGRKQRQANNRYRRKNGYDCKDWYLPYSDLIELSKGYLRTGFLCYYCKIKMSIGIADNPDTCTVDHCISIGKGGDNTIENLVLCCEDCNRRKGGRKYDKQNKS